MRKQILWTILALCTGLMLAQGGISGTGQVSVVNVPPVLLYGAPIQFSFQVNLSGVTGSAAVGLGGFVVPAGFDTTKFRFGQSTNAELPGDPNTNPPSLTFVNTDPAIANANGFFAVVGATSVDSVGPNYIVANNCGWANDIGTIALDMTAPAGAPAQVALSLSSKWTAGNGGPANISAAATDSSFTLTGLQPVAVGDYDGDGLTNLVVYRPADGAWFVRHTDGSYDSYLWGDAGTTPSPVSYVTPGQTDITVYQPSTGVWYLRHTDGSYEAYLWGNSECIPVAGNYLSPTRTDITVYQPSTGVWYIRHTDGSYEAYLWGDSQSVPVPGSYTVAGVTDIAIYHVPDSIWYIRHWDGSYSAYLWGDANSIPVPGNYDVAGITNVAIYQLTTQTWYIRHADGSYNAYIWGNPGDIPMPGQYFTPGITNIAVYRPSTGEWIIRNNDGSPTVITWGNAECVALAK